MKLAISSSGKTLDSPLDPRFGRCDVFTFVDVENGEIKKGLAKMASPLFFVGAGGGNRTRMDARSAGF